MTCADKIILDVNALQSQLDRAPRPIVFTNGCFDILHRGHVAYLEEAAGLGSTLIVALNSDRSVKSLNKGNDRPINPLEDRMALIAALEFVDWVTQFDETTPLELISRLLPDCLVKGGDWEPDEIVGADIVSANGGSVHSIPIRYSRSTTALMERLRNS